MVRDQNGSVSRLSSIALLQERFKQLQRMKELRQEQELQRALSESERCSPPTPQVMKYGHPPKAECQLALSLWPDSEKKGAGGSQSREVPSSSSSSSSSSSNVVTNSTELICTLAVGFENYSGGSDIDTSLRL